METDYIYGFNWPSTKAGEVAIANCSARLDMTVATRSCDINGVWDNNIDVSNCESHTYSSISTRVNNLCTYINYVIRSHIILVVAVFA